MRKLFAVPLMALALAGCATPYHAENFDGGYSEQQLSANTFRVSFKGNLRSKQDETNDMALLRCAELAIKNGYPWFLTSGNAPTGTGVSVATNVVSVPATTITFVGYKTKPETTAVIYDADQLMTTLGARYYKHEER